MWAASAVVVMEILSKQWDEHVSHAEEIARGQGFQELRDAIVDRAGPRLGDKVLDIGAGTGLLTLAVAKDVSHVWALDISQAMCSYLQTKAQSAELANIETVVASAVSLPMVEESVDLVISNYCLHHLSEDDKLRALQEVWRVLVPGGRFVFGDMMFEVAVTDTRGRQVLSSKVKAMLRRGPAGFVRLGKNAVRALASRWEKPAPPEWWEQALVHTGFTQVSVDTFPHEGAVAMGRKPGSSTGDDR